MSRWTLIAAVTVGAAAGWGTTPVVEPAPIGVSKQVQRYSPLAVPDCAPCEATAKDESACDQALLAAIATKRDALFDEHWADLRPLDWPIVVAASEQPDAVVARIDEFVARCLRKDAAVSIRCDEYPCMVAYRRSDVIGADCDADWSPLDRMHNASVNRDHTNVYRYGLDLNVSDQQLEAVQRRRVPRTNLMGGDLMVGTVRRMPFK